MIEIMVAISQQNELGDLAQPESECGFRRNDNEAIWLDLLVLGALGLMSQRVAPSPDHRWVGLAGPYSVQQLSRSIGQPVYLTSLLSFGPSYESSIPHGDAL